MSAMFHYWDTSALVKLYAPEPDSPAFQKILIANNEQPVVSFLHRVELYYALRQKEARHEMTPGSAARLFSLFLKHLTEGRFHYIPWREELAVDTHAYLERCLAMPNPVNLRSLDGLHLGAFHSSGATGLVTTDSIMRRAATQLGILLVDP